jgi:thioredoxin-related protein
MSFLKTFISFCLLVVFLNTQSISAQKAKVNWITFEQLDDSLAVKPKKVLISFYADWCSYCKKMDKVAFRDPKVVETLNSEYYAVKMNAETEDDIVFEGKKFINEEVGKKRRATHQIPLLLASRKGRPFSLPAIVILDENFQVTGRYFEYLSTKKMLGVLK